MNKTTGKRSSKKVQQTKTMDIVAALSGVTKEKSISMDMVLDTLKDALVTGAKRYLGTPVNVEAKIDHDKGMIEVFTRQTVVETVEDAEKQIALTDAKQIDAELEVGDELIQDLDIDEFGRTAIMTAKQVIVQRVREAEREKIFSDYSERVGELVTGTVQQIDKGTILVNLGRTEAILPYKEQIHKERYRQGSAIRGCIVDVKHNSKGPQVIISRTCPEFLARLFELEVPEIFDKTVRIVKVVRDPGHRSKIAVSTTDERVDPVGACVGMRGNRVQAIVRELSNERIDIINWTEELSLLVRRVFSPAEVKRVFPVGDAKIVAIIKNEDLAQAIGREGQNIRLASKMIDKEIDVYGDEEYSAFSEEKRNAIMSGLPVPEEFAPAPVEGEEAPLTAEFEPEVEDVTKLDVVAEPAEPVEETSETEAIVNEALEEISEGDKDVEEEIDKNNEPKSDTEEA
ncbi:MAG: transcription termination factor NusA [Chitinivibrionales bacterium]|nr:transcription termination factor NusA [Chitinivibrionales bacterium]